MITKSDFSDIIFKSTMLAYQLVAKRVKTKIEKGGCVSEFVYRNKEELLYSQRVAQLSKALWRVIEKDWQCWIKPYDLNINEHHILTITYYMKGASVSDVAKYGSMHVSTAFNFSKKLEERGYLTFSKRDDDKRNTYIEITSEGKALIDEANRHYFDTPHAILDGSLKIKELYGRFPEFLEVTAIVRNIYGNEFVETLEQSFQNLSHTLDKIDNEVQHNELMKEA